MKYKKIMTIALVASMTVSATAFAAPATGSKTKTEASAATEGKTVYTFEKALELAKKNSSTLSLLEQNGQLLNNQSENISQTFGGISSWGSSPGAVSTPDYGSIMALSQIAATRESDGYKKEAALLSLEGGIMQSMGIIVTGEAELKTSALTLSNAQADYNMVVLKKGLGLATDTEVTAAKATLDSIIAKVDSTEKSVENAYANLAIVMGIRDTDFEVEYNPGYELYKLNGDLDTFLLQKNKENPSLKATQASVNYLINNKDFMIINDESLYSYDTINYNIDSAEAGLKAQNDGYINAGRETYKNILSTEKNIEALESGLKAAEDALSIAEINLNLGTATQLDVDKAKENLETTKNNILSAKISHAYLVFAFENPAGSGSAGA